MERGHAVQWRLESDVFCVFADFAQRSESVHGECFVAGGVNPEVLLVRPNSTCEAEEVLLPRAGDKRRMAVSMVVVKVYWEQARGSARPTGTTFPISMWTAPFFGEQSGRGRTLHTTSRKHFQMKKAVVPGSLGGFAVGGASSQSPMRTTDKIKYVRKA